MDPITQGLLGAVGAQALFAAPGAGSAVRRRVTLAGLAGGLLPDADVALQPLADPALPWELHRHFTHGLVMAPVMGALAAGLLLLLRPGWRSSWRLVLVAAVAGALTHAPLDLCTSYGTKILWPFSLADLTLDLFPIVDPVFSLVLLVGMIAAWRRGRRALAAVGVFLALYIGLAVVQQHAAHGAQATLAAARGHRIERQRVMPLPGSLLVWRSLYETDGRLHADLLRPVPWGPTQGAVGGQRARIPWEAFVARAAPGDRERVAQVAPRLATFAADWTAWADAADGEPHVWADMRFSAGPGFRPLWGLALRRDEGPAVTWWMAEDARRLDLVGELLQWIAGTHPDLRPIGDMGRAPR